MYAKLEEDHGLARHAMSVYQRATNALLPDEKYEVDIFEIENLAFKLLVELFA